MRLTAERVAADFNLALANRHKEASRSGLKYEFNFAELTREINDFRQQNYPNVPAESLPTVDEIETVVRKKWNLKSVLTRKQRAAARKKREAAAKEAARQFELF